MEGAQKTTIGKYLTKLAKDKDALREYHAGPKAAMTRAGLSQADQNLILSDDVEAIRQVIESEYKTAIIALIVHP